MQETLKTAAMLTSASVAVCAFIVGVIHYANKFAKYLKAKKQKQMMDKNERLKVQKIKDDLYLHYLETKKKEQNNG